VQHQIWQILCNGQLLTAPHSQATSLLDLGCGSGVWTAAIARNFPEINVFGVDITPPANDFGLPNLTFVTADMEQTWEFAREQRDGCDLIVARVLVSAIRDWPALIRRCFEHLKPGGWIEIPDISIGTFSDSFDWRDECSLLMRWCQCYRKGALTNGIDAFANQKRVNHLTDAKFAHISEKLFKCYLGENAVTEVREKEIARLKTRNLLSLLDAVTKTMQDRAQWDALKITSSELQQLNGDAKSDLHQYSASRRYYWNLYVVAHHAKSSYQELIDSIAASIRLRNPVDAMPRSPLGVYWRRRARFRT